MCWLTAAVGVLVSKRLFVPQATTHLHSPGNSIVVVIIIIIIHHPSSR